MLINKIEALRKELHQFPELSGREERTTRRIREFIGGQTNATIISGLGSHGLAIIFEYSPGPVIMLRCELDALPIEEVNTFGHRSKQKGVSHKCGHDGHMAIMAGMSLWLKEQSFQKGKVILLFQPAEETGKGAFSVLEDPRFSSLRPDFIFAFHNIPGEPLHSIIVAETNFSTTVQSVAIELKGAKSHASEPEKGINPACAMAEIILEFAELNQNDISAENFAVLTPVYSSMGTKDYGISAGSGQLHYTIRTRSDEKMDQLKLDIVAILQKISGKFTLKYTTSWFDYFPATVNNQTCNGIIKTAAQENNLPIKMQSHAFKFGEDFGWFSKRYKAAMFGIGAGVNCPALHKEDYDFPDEILSTGVKMFGGIINQIMNSSQEK